MLWDFQREPGDFELMLLVKPVEFAFPKARAQV